MADTYVKGRLKKTSGNNAEFRLPRTSLDNIVKNADSATTYIASNNVIKGDYLPLANGSDTAGIVKSGDTRLTILNGAISFVAQGDIENASTAEELRRAPTVDAVKTYVSSKVGTAAYLDTLAKSSASSSTLIASNFKIKPEYMTSANGTSAGVVYNNDTARLTITNGGLQINVQTDITGATTTAELAKVPTTSAVKDYVSSYVEENAGKNDVMAGVIIPSYTEGERKRLIVCHDAISPYTSENEVYLTYPAEKDTSDPDDKRIQVDVNHHGLGGTIIGEIQVKLLQSYEPADQPLLYVGLRHIDSEYEEKLIIRTHFNNVPSTMGYTYETVHINIPIPPNYEFYLRLNKGVTWTNYPDASHRTANTLFFYPNIGYAIPGSTISNATISDN